MFRKGSVQNKPHQYYDWCYWSVIWKSDIQVKQTFLTFISWSYLFTLLHFPRFSWLFLWCCQPESPLVHICMVQECLSRLFFPFLSQIDNISWYPDLTINSQSPTVQTFMLFIITCSWSVYPDDHFIVIIASIFYVLCVFHCSWTEFRLILVI